MPFIFRALALAAAAFSLVALAGCDAQRISELQPGISTEADVRDRFGVPETIWDGPMARAPWNTTASPPGRSIT